MQHVVFSEPMAEELIVEYFGNRELNAFRTCAVPAMQADYLRYCALLCLGGVYVDVDFHCIASLGTLRGAGVGTLFGLPELLPPGGGPGRRNLNWREKVGPFRALNNNIFAFRAPGHPLLELAVEIATMNIESRLSQDVAIVTGPGIFTNLYFAHELGSLEAYLAYVRGSYFEHSSAVFCEAAGCFARIERAFAGVRVRPMEEAMEWVKPPKESPAYKRSAVHWPRFRSNIFR